LIIAVGHAPLQLFQTLISVFIASSASLKNRYILHAVAKHPDQTKLYCFENKAGSKIAVIAQHTFHYEKP
jgi:hypothetical protein